QGQVTFNQPAPGPLGAVVTLTSSVPAAVAVPANITIPAGSATAAFTIMAGPVAASTSVTISAAINGVGQSAILTVFPLPVPISYTLSPWTMVGPGVVTTATVALSQAAPSGGVVVTLSASDTKSAKFPSTVTVAAGQSSVSFP